MVGIDKFELDPDAPVSKASKLLGAVAEDEGEPVGSKSVAFRQ